MYMKLSRFTHVSSATNPKPKGQPSYHIAGNFHGRSIFTTFAGLIFVDACSHAHYVLYSRAYFAGLICTVRRSSVKTAKIGPLENFPLYGIACSERKGE